MKRIMNSIKNFMAKLRFVKGEKFKNLNGKEKALKLTWSILRLIVFAILACTVGAVLLAIYIGARLIGGLDDAAQASANVMANNKVWRRY